MPIGSGGQLPWALMTKGFCQSCCFVFIFLYGFKDTVTASHHTGFGLSFVSVVGARDT